MAENTKLHVTELQNCVLVPISPVPDKDALDYGLLKRSTAKLTFGKKVKTD